MAACTTGTSAQSAASISAAAAIPGKWQKTILKE